MTQDVQPVISLDKLMLGRYPRAASFETPDGEKMYGALYLPADGRRTLESLAAEIVGGERLADLTAAYRRMIERLGKNDQECKDFKARQLPAVMLSGVCAEGARNLSRNPKAWPVRHTGLYQVDIDRLSGMDEAVAVRNRAAGLPYVALAYVSPSGGVKVVVRGQPPAAGDRDGHVREWEHANRTVAQALGRDFDSRQVDPAVKSVIALCFLSHDPDAYYNPMCQTLDAAPPAKSKPKRTAPTGGAKSDSDDKLAAECTEFLRINLPPPGDDTYNDWTGTAIAVAQGWGVDAYLEWIAGSGRPNERVNDLERFLADTDANWQGALRSIAKRWGWRTERMLREERRQPAAIGKTAATPVGCLECGLAITPEQAAQRNGMCRPCHMRAASSNAPPDGDAPETTDPPDRQDDQALKPEPDCRMRLDESARKYRQGDLDGARQALRQAGDAEGADQPDNIRRLEAARQALFPDTPLPDDEDVMNDQPPAVEATSLPSADAVGYVSGVLAEGRRLIADRQYRQAARTLGTLDGRKDLTPEELADWVSQHGLLSVADWRGQPPPDRRPSSVRNSGWTDEGRAQLAAHHRQNPPSYPCDCAACGS